MEGGCNGGRERVREGGREREGGRGEGGESEGERQRKREGDSVNR